ncbi:MAG TPA: hypothetical protein VFT22_20670 [Kofleriaceae bacterium]|nr:hypothetical protein [Kofleriaceae bacterium]
MVELRLDLWPGSSLAPRAGDLARAIRGIPPAAPACAAPSLGAPV